MEVQQRCERKGKEYTAVPAYKGSLAEVQRLASKGSTGSTPFCDPEDHTLLINIVDCSIGLNGHTVQFPVHFPFHSVQLLTSSQPLIFHRYIHLQGQLSRNT
eukprot:1157566-Pelagomonas_calceolata.AAC.4